MTTAFCVPTMLAALCAVPDVGQRPLALRQMIYSGSPISETALAAALAALRCEFVQIYGLTEATGAFAQLPASEHGPEGRAAGRCARQDPVPVGRGQRRGPDLGHQAAPATSARS